MRLKPNQNDDPEDEMENYELEAIEEVLEEAGVTRPNLSNLDANAELKELLDLKGGSLESVANQLVYLMTRSENDSARLRALDFVAKLQGIKLQEETAPVAQDVTINIVGDENKSLINFVMPAPQAPRKEEETKK